MTKTAREHILMFYGHETDKPNVPFDLHPRSQSLHVPCSEVACAFSLCVYIGMSEPTEKNYSPTSVLERLGSQTIWFSSKVFTEKMSRCLTKLRVSILCPTALSCRCLCDLSHVSQVTDKGDSVFKQIPSRTVFQSELSPGSEGVCYVCYYRPYRNADAEDVDRRVWTSSYEMENSRGLTDSTGTTVDNRVLYSWTLLGV